MPETKGIPAPSLPQLEEQAVALNLLKEAVGPTSEKVPSEAVFVMAAKPLALRTQREVSQEAALRKT